MNRTIVNQSNANKNNGLCLFNNVNKTGTMSSNPYTGGETKFVSLGNSLNVELNLNPLHATLSYFKYDVPLFEATYEFVHGPLCGPSIIHPVDEGELVFPRFDAMGFVEPPKSLECIWEIRVNKDRDLWLHFNQVNYTYLYNLCLLKLRPVRLYTCIQISFKYTYKIYDCIPRYKYNIYVHIVNR